MKYFWSITLLSIISIAGCDGIIGEKASHPDPMDEWIGMTLISSDITVAPYAAREDSAVALVTTELIDVYADSIVIQSELNPRQDVALSKTKLNPGTVIMSRQVATKWKLVLSADDPHGGALILDITERAAVDPRTGTVTPVKPELVVVPFLRMGDTFQIFGSRYTKAKSGQR